MSEQGHKLGDVLRAAREAKGVDLVRVERETKIRARYLTALESGQYRDLPGAVYTKGFLRNYGLYLGLDPEYLVDLFRLETASPSADRPSVAGPPRPIAARRRRAFVVTPGAILAAILTVGVVAFVGWLGWEFFNFARTPELRITHPAGPIAMHDETTYLVQGQTAPNARVSVEGARENPSVTADIDGRFEVMVSLVPGSNIITLTAFDPATARDSLAVSRTIVVGTDGGSPSPGIGLTVDRPVADATSTSPLPIAGRSTANATVEVAAILASAPVPGFTIVDLSGESVPVTPAATSAPDPLTLTTAADGAFSGELALPPGTWDLTVSSGDGEPVTRRVTVTPPEGLVGTLRIDGGQSYIELEQDGEPVDGVSGGISEPGATIPLAATTELRIRAGNAAAVRIVLNGLDIGAMGGSGAVVEWRISLTSSE